MSTLTATMHNSALAEFMRDKEDEPVTLDYDIYENRNNEIALIAADFNLTYGTNQAVVGYSLESKGGDLYPVGDGSPTAIFTDGHDNEFDYPVYVFMGTDPKLDGVEMELRHRFATLHCKISLLPTNDFVPPSTYGVIIQDQSLWYEISHSKEDGAFFSTKISDDPTKPILEKLELYIANVKDGSTANLQAWYINQYLLWEVYGDLRALTEGQGTVMEYISRRFDEEIAVVFKIEQLYRDHDNLSMSSTLRDEMDAITRSFMIPLKAGRKEALAQFDVGQVTSVIKDQEFRQLMRYWLLFK